MGVGVVLVLFALTVLVLLRFGCGSVSGRRVFGGVVSVVVVAVTAVHRVR